MESLIKIAKYFLMWALLWYGIRFSGLITEPTGTVNKVFKKYRPAGTIGYWLYTIIVRGILFLLCGIIFWGGFQIAESLGL